MCFKWGIPFTVSLFILHSLKCTVWTLRLLRCLLSSAVGLTNSAVSQFCGYHDSPPRFLPVPMASQTMLCLRRKCCICAGHDFASDWCPVIVSVAHPQSGEREWTTVCLSSVERTAPYSIVIATWHFIKIWCSGSRHQNYYHRCFRLLQNVMKEIV